MLKIIREEGRGTDQIGNPLHIQCLRDHPFSVIVRYRIWVRFTCGLTHSPTEAICECAINATVEIHGKMYNKQFD